MAGVAPVAAKANGRFDAGMCDESDDYEASYLGLGLSARHNYWIEDLRYSAEVFSEVAS